MNDFIERLQEEKSQLGGRIEKLNTFRKTDAFKKLDVSHMALLNIQSRAMETYWQILDERLELLTTKS
jgi:hypothetical protein